ncbi:LuxR C-terminal-related transcriptional regulator [Gemmatimonas sp.]|uniref:LuxR C-terminal-related transcriptional regulator n=1 Tax=Gemmatimonas sp. TaxID=1962908 RepID=UPI003F6FA8E7
MQETSPESQETLRESRVATFPVSLIVIDGRRTVRARTVAKLLHAPGFSLLAAVDAVAGVPALSPTLFRGAPIVALLDISVADPDCLAGCNALRATLPQLRIIITGMTVMHEDVAAYVHAGATGFIMQSASPSQFVETVRHVANDEPSLPRALTMSLFSQIRSHAAPVAGLSPADQARLTKRERQIIGLLREGMSNKEIADRLYIAVHTVKRHVHNILEKLSLHSRLEVAAHARTPGERP